MNVLDFERDDELLKGAVGAVRPLSDLHEVRFRLARRCAGVRFPSFAFTFLACLSKKR